MDLNNATLVLVIIESITFTIFLIISIVALVYAIKVIKAIQRLTDRAELLADKAEAVGEMVGRAAGPLAVGRFLTHIADNVLTRGNKGKKESNDE